MKLYIKVLKSPYKYRNITRNSVKIIINGNNRQLTENDSNEDDSNDPHNNHHLRERKKFVKISLD